MWIGVAAVSTGSCDWERWHRTLFTRNGLMSSNRFTALNEYIHFAVALLFLTQYSIPMTSCFLIMFLLSPSPFIKYSAFPCESHTEWQSSSLKLRSVYSFTVYNFSISFLHLVQSA